MKNNLIEYYFEISGGKKENEKEFYILKNKKSERSVIFQKGNKEAIRFMKNKSFTPIKKMGYFLIRINILQIFLKKIKLDPSVGQLLFFGGQTKIFDFNKKRVISFLRGHWGKRIFIKTKKNQKKLSEKGFAPRIFKINKKIPFCVEELLEGNNNIKNEDIFKKLLKYYDTQKGKKVSYSTYIGEMEKKNSFEKLPSSLKEKLRKLKTKKKSFYVLKIHGDFEKSQILLRGKEILFTDWHTQEDLILIDLLNFFRKEKNLLKNKGFLSILDLFPKEATENLKDYVLIFQVKTFFPKESK